MISKLLSFIVVFISMVCDAQGYVFGNVYSENKVELSAVTVFNLRTLEKTTTNKEGHFMISARAGDVLRFVYAGYDRLDQKVLPENEKNNIIVLLNKSAKLIEEVEIKQKVTGDFLVDSQLFGPSKRVKKLNAELSMYIKRKSDPKVMAHAPGEFVQPKVEGIAIGKIKNKWDDIDLMNYLIEILGAQYFEELNIPKSQIGHFVLYILNSGFERNKILKYGWVTQADLFRFQSQVLKKIEGYPSPPASPK